VLEAAAALTCTKPGLDAWKVASGAKQQQGAAFAPLLELAYAKGAEVAVESVPGLVLQLIAVLSSSASKRELVSIAISAASTGLAGASM
jgi:hypothetical protein